MCDLPSFSGGGRRHLRVVTERGGAGRIAAVFRRIFGVFLLIYKWVVAESAVHVRGFVVAPQFWMDQLELWITRSEERLKRS